MISDQQLSKIVDNANANIVSIINHYGPELDTSSQRGTRGKALCPFHNEQTPSFHVTNTKGIYKCFGCGKGGDAVDFLMEYKGYGFIEAIRELARYLNITINETASSRSKDYKSPAEIIDGINKVKHSIRKTGEARLCFSKKDAKQLQKKGIKNLLHIKTYRSPQVELLARYAKDAIFYPEGLNKQKFFMALRITADEDLDIKIAKQVDDQPVHWIDFVIQNFSRTKEIRHKCLRIIAGFDSDLKRAVERKYFSKKWNRNSKESLG